MHDPYIVCLVGIIVILRNAIASAVVLLQMLKRLLHRRPGGAQKFRIFLASENVVAINHEHELAVQILPVVSILPTERINLSKRIFLGDSKIVRYCAFGFANSEVKRSRL